VFAPENIWFDYIKKRWHGEPFPFSVDFIDKNSSRSNEREL
jgi:hypothetical protein